MKSTAFFSFLLLGLALLLSSCGSDKPGPQTIDSAQRASDQKAYDSTAAVAASYLKDSAYYTTLSKNPAQLTGGEKSTDAVVRAVLEGLRKNDTLALRDLLIDRNEYLTIIYPELGKHWPGARDLRPEIVGALWINHIENARKGLRRAVGEMGGMELKLESVEFADGTKEYVSYKIHEGTTVTVRDAEGKEHKISAIGSIVEKDGVFKLLSYRDRDGD